MVFLFGKTADLSKPNSRTSTIVFPKTSPEDHDHTLIYPSDDGIVLTLLKRIEKLEARDVFLSGDIKPLDITPAKKKKN